MKMFPNTTLINVCKRYLSMSKSVNNIGFIGLGNMGNHMARNLMKNGEKVFVYDINRDSVKVMESEGAIGTKSPSDLAPNCSTIITMLPSSPHAMDVYTSKANGILTTVKKGTLLLDSSTIDPAVSREIGHEASKHGTIYLDCPVSGGINAAKDAILTFMVGGGDLKVFEEAKKILEKIGKNIIHCGPLGTGQAAKICNNMLLGISMIGTAETMNLGVNLGLKPQLLASILNTSSGRCWSSELYNPYPGVLPNVPASNNYDGGFGTALMKKDLGLANDAATVTKSATPLGEMTYKIYCDMVEKKMGNKDFSIALKYLQENYKN